MHRVRGLRLLIGLMLIAGGAAAAADADKDEPRIVVNGAPVAAEKMRSLEQRYHARIADGRYWYDRNSGAWGFEGGPAMGQIEPGLALGGALRADASHGNTGVFVNGRELHILDVRALQRCTPVIPGRYWVNARGIGGYEGGPPSFDLAALCGRRSAGGSSTQTECFSNGCQSTNSRTVICVLTDGQCHGSVFVPVSGMIMTPN